MDVAKTKPYRDMVEYFVRPAISLIVLIAGLFVILSKRYEADQEKWAFGSLGTVLGFWLKTGA